jgi:hypothetical protein
MDFAPFISGWYIKPDVCDSLIAYFEESPNKNPGKVGGPVRIDLDRKDSLDVVVSPKDSDERIQQYLSELKTVCNNYIEQYPWSSNQQAAWGINQNFNIQRYLPRQGFKAWHCERSGPAAVPVTRHLVFMTYLNDVTDEGGTEWFHQQLTISPKKGLTIIWPTDWTHLHRGVVSPTQTKYITTGWYSYNLEGNI